MLGPDFSLYFFIKLANTMTYLREVPANNFTFQFIFNSPLSENSGTNNLVCADFISSQVETVVR